MDHPNRPVFLQIPNDLTYLESVLSFAREVALSSGFPENEASKIEVALEEAFTNVVRHSFGQTEATTFEFSVHPSSVMIEFRFTDKGRPLNPVRVEGYDPGELEPGKEVRGLGSFLIKQLMDVVEYRALGNQGKMIRMVKYRKDTEAASGSRAPLVPPAPPADGRDLPPIDFSIHRLKPEEAFQVAELAYDTYGYSYLYEHIYFPERVTALNLTNELISILAVTPEGEVAGHVGMVCDPGIPGLGELALAMIKPKFRGYKLLEKISATCIGEALSLGIRGMYVQATTIHTYSQPVPKKAGMKPVGFILGYISPMNLKNIEESARERVTPVVSFKTLQTVDAGSLYIPLRHDGMVRKLLTDVSIGWKPGLPVTMEKDQSVYTVTVNPVSLLARIIVYETGRDILHSLKQVLVRIREESLLIGELFLNLTEALTAEYYDRIEDLGFIFTGILPGSSRGTFITLVYLNGINVHFDTIHLIEDNGQDLLAYIRQDYDKRFLE